MKLYALAVSLVLCAFAYPAHALPSCEEMKRIKASLPQDQINQLIARATPEQIAIGKACFGAKSVKGQKVTKKGPQRGKKHPKQTVHKVHKVVPVPRPAPLPKVENVEKSVEPLPFVNPPTAQQEEQVTPPTQETHMTEFDWIIKLFGFFGVVAFTYAVGKWGFLPVINWFKQRAAAGRQVELEFWARIHALETQVEVLNRKIAPPATTVPPA